MGLVRAGLWGKARPIREAGTCSVAHGSPGCAGPILLHHTPHLNQTGASPTAGGLQRPWASSQGSPTFGHRLCGTARRQHGFGLICSLSPFLTACAKHLVRAARRSVPGIRFFCDGGPILGRFRGIMAWDPRTSRSPGVFSHALQKEARELSAIYLLGMDRAKAPQGDKDEGWKR
jgi:hypothetical protein